MGEKENFIHEIFWWRWLCQAENFPMYVDFLGNAGVVGRASFFHFETCQTGSGDSPGLSAIHSPYIPELNNSMKGEKEGRMNREEPYFHHTPPQAPSLFQCRALVPNIAINCE